MMKRAPIANIENCTNCFKKFHFFSKRLECQLCKFSFCGSCSLIKNYKQADTGEVVRHRLCHQCEKTLTDLDQKKKTNEQIINANIASNVTLNQAQANFQIQQVLWDNRAFAYSHAKDILGLNSTELIDYIQSDLISKSDNLLTNLNFN